MRRARIPLPVRRWTASRARVPGEAGYRHGDTVSLTPNLEHLHRFDDKGLALR